jgi:hypothetical protein
MSIEVADGLARTADGGVAIWHGRTSETLGCATIS